MLPALVVPCIIVEGGCVASICQVVLFVGGFVRCGLFSFVVVDISGVPWLGLHGASAGTRSWMMGRQRRPFQNGVNVFMNAEPARCWCTEGSCVVAPCRGL